MEKSRSVISLKVLLYDFQDGEKARTATTEEEGQEEVKEEDRT